MTAAENIKVSGLILDDSYFESADEFYDDMSDFGSDGFFQTPGINQHTTGTFDDNMLFDQIDLGWVSDDYGITINNERVKYVSQARPHPDGFTPFQRIDGKFSIVNREVDHTNAAESAYARQRAYHLVSLTAAESLSLYNINQVSARIAVISDFVVGAANATGDLGLEPLDQTATTGTHSEFGSYNVEADGKVLFNSYPMRWLGGMMTTRNRWGMKMDEPCRIEARLKMPKGSRVGTDLNNFNQMENVFAAFWMLQQLFHNRDVNGEVHSHGVQTFMPFTNSGRLNECDNTEHLGHDPNVSLHTIHHHNDLVTGEPLAYQDMVAKYIPHRNLPNSIFSQEKLDFDATDGFHDYVVDFATDYIGMSVDGRYLARFTMPADWINPLPFYETQDNNGYSVLKENGFGIHNGDVQRHSDGTARYMEMQIIANGAMTGKFTVDQMYSDISNKDSFAQFEGNPSMQIEYIRAVRLKEGLLKTYNDNGTPQFTGYDIVANRPDGGNCLVATARI